MQSILIKLELLSYQTEDDFKWKYLSLERLVFVSTLCKSGFIGIEIGI